ncbi:TPA: hypothetical protein G8M32_004655 [Salmonella enterica]|nr:hypothetical protein [Salmonella enterica]
MKKVQFFLTCLPVLCAPAVYAKALPGKNTAIISPVPARPADPLTTDDNSFLPLLGEVAKTHGYDLPEPFGINVNYMNMRQNIDVDSIRFSGLGLTGHAFPSDLFDIQASHTRERSITKTVKLDAWLFPFMNIYALVGKTRGSSHSTVSVDSSPANGFISSIIHGMNESGALKNLDFSLRFHGTTYGAGTVLAGGYGNWYGLMDINYTRTDFNILDGHTDAFTLTPRVGYRFTTPGVEILSLPAGKLSVWVGTMYQNVQQTFRGKLSDLNIPASFGGLMTLADQNGNGRFEVKQHLHSPWNLLAGASYEITRNVNVTTEVGFAERNSVLVSAEYRF